MRHDTLEMVIEALASTMDVWVADVLPPADQLDPSRCFVVVDEMPGTEHVPWGGFGPGLSVVALDVDVYGPSRAQTRPVRARVHQMLMGLPAQSWSGVTRVIVDSSFHTRPDLNPNIRRVGAEYSLMVHSGT